MILINVLLFILTLILGIFAIIGLARMDLFFTIVEEGTAKAVMSLDGYHRIIFQYKGKKIDEAGNIVDSKIEEKRSRLVGLRWLGIPGIHHLYKYHFRWTTLRPQSGELLKREDILSHVLLRDDVYVATIESAETKSMVPLTIQLLITARCINPYKTLFAPQDWMEMLLSRIEAIFRQYVSEYEFEELVKQRQKASEEMMKSVTKTGIVEELENVYGIKIRAMEMRKIDPAGEIKGKFEDAATTKWTAEKEAEGIQVRAKAEKDRIKTVYETVESFGDLGTALRYLETIGMASQKQGNWIIPFDLQQMLGSIFKK